MEIVPIREPLCRGRYLRQCHDVTLEYLIQETHQEMIEYLISWWVSCLTLYCSVPYHTMACKVYLVLLRIST